MSELLWIIIFGLLMSCIALVGGITLIFREELFGVIILPLIAFAAGSLVGGATFHMIPAAVNKMGNTTELCVAEFWFSSILWTRGIHPLASFPYSLAWSPLVCTTPCSSASKCTIELT